MGGLKLQTDSGIGCVMFLSQPAEGLRQVGFDGRRGYTRTIVGLAAFIDHVTMFDHAQRRIGAKNATFCAIYI